MTYEKFTKNRPENRLIKATLKKLQKVATDEKNKRDARELLLFFDGIQESMDYRQDLARIRNRGNLTGKQFPEFFRWAYGQIHIICHGGSF